ncbi:MAG: hypothetical protein AAFR81_22425 [Chloroflexota bacterium]
MPKKFSPEKKAEAFFLLIKTFGDTYYVSQETGISERTLRYWKSSYVKHITATLEHAPNAERARRQQQYANIRESLYKHINGLLFQLELNPTADRVAQLAPTLARLIDRLTSIEKLLVASDFTIVVKPLPQEIITALPENEKEAQQQEDDEMWERLKNDIPDF